MSEGAAIFERFIQIKWTGVDQNQQDLDNETISNLLNNYEAAGGRPLQGLVKSMMAMIRVKMEMEQGWNSG